VPSNQWDSAADAVTDQGRRPTSISIREVASFVLPTAAGRGSLVVLLRLAYLDVSNALAMLRPLPMSHRAKDAEILALRHQVTVHLARRITTSARHWPRCCARDTPAAYGIARPYRVPAVPRRQAVEPSTTPG
jgi:hypothetical protein